MPVLTALQGRFFHGWVVVSGAFFVSLVSFGVAYTFSTFFDALKSQFDASRGDVSFVFALTGFIYFGLGAVSGPLADRIGPRRVIAAGIICIGAGLLLASVAQSLWQVYLTYSLGVGFGVGFAYVPAIGAVQRWFVKRRGSASGIAVTGIGIGTVAFPLIADGLIAWQGWRGAYVSLAILSLAIGIPAALLVENSPERRGLNPDGAREDDALHASALGGMAAPQAMRTAPFWLMYIAAVLAGLGLFTPFVHLVPYAKDHGLSSTQGALLIAFIGIGSSVGRLFIGAPADRFGRKASLAAAYAAMAGSLFVWLGAQQFWSLSLFALLFGVSYGGFVALSPALTTDFFGAKSASGIIGWSFTGAAIGSLAGPTLAGFFYDATGSYTVPILFGAVANVAAAALIVFLASPEQYHAKNPPAAPAIVVESP
jgi:MFS family permease